MGGCSTQRRGGADITRSLKKEGSNKCDFIRRCTLRGVFLMAIEIDKKLSKNKEREAGSGKKLEPSMIARSERYIPHT
ncbi:hypothetical protein LSTR_LSTR001026 [Laodelphax striatellus]|uniref:Uncharacterized protein n=1 Tax=Laodelphax striatellus TaxID=195883 RepID=A0A482X0Y2_LAOST|nr:hypothetical protein LSTR_LSTR001026 [Laodelphax striatellus]